MSDEPRQLRFDDGKDPQALRTIGEVAAALGIKQHVLRYWEQQFPALRPLKRSGGRRYYRTEDVELLSTIDRLVNREGYTLKGARQLLDQGKEGAAVGEGQEHRRAPQFSAATGDVLPQLQAIRARLSSALS
ncbi:conserved hypothetical protein [Altererythrobacter sp. B11]|uniref:MerR family transcriptional regulator n=1 Tax=Altererythrobacter sp. B11 TaxID=2060312 RepID=UPI000DC72349|nr:MerR family transcriptional regulator [Altererythrobacter sp. B11]BBC73693.1 conserved hypothetical protein [Altererythrobacter sp. B11]